MKTTTQSKILLTIFIFLLIAMALWLTLLSGLWRLTGIALLLAGIAMLVWVWWPGRGNQ